MKWFREKLAARRRRRTMRHLREHFDFFGIDTSNMSDEEIEERVLMFGRIVKNMGVTFEEAAKALDAACMRMYDA